MLVPSCVVVNIVRESKARAVLVRAISRGVHLLWGAPTALRLLGRADGGIVPAGV